MGWHPPLVSIATEMGGGGAQQGANKVKTHAASQTGCRDMEKVFPPPFIASGNKASYNNEHRHHSQSIRVFIMHNRGVQLMIRLTALMMHTTQLQGATNH